MRFNKFVGTMAAATLSLAAMTSAANAQNLPLLSFGGDTPTPGQVVFTSNNAGGGLLSSNITGSPVSLTSGPAGNIEPDLDAFFRFGPVSLQSTNLDAFGGIRAQFSGAGSGFTITSLANGAGTTYLTGTLGSVILTGDNGGGTGQARVGFNGVTYTGGTLLAQFSALNPGFSNTGNFVLNLLTLIPAAGQPNPLGINAGGGLGSFSSTQISGNFNVSPVPEPSEWLAMGMAATSVGGLMFRAKLKLRAKRQQVAA